MKASFRLSLAGFLVFMTGIISASGQVEIKTIDGVKHVINPAKPLKGVVKLEVEKSLEIDPYAISDLNLRMLYYARAADGSVVLYDPNQAEAGLFSSQGKFLGRLFPKGQGPGEFSSGVNIYAIGGGFLATNLFSKIAKFDKNGIFIEEWKIGRPAFLILDEENFLEEDRGSDTRTVRLIHAPRNGQASHPPVVLFGAKETWIHRANDGSNKGFGNVFVTPYIRECYDSGPKNIYIALNKSISIHVFDLEGKMRFVIDKPHNPIKLSRKEKEKIVRWKDAADNWMIDVCPDHLVALRDLVPMPGGRLGALRFISPDKAELDVFDAEGRFVYTLIWPDEIPLSNRVIIPSGFAGSVYREETNVYVEYRVKNLPEIFR